MDILISSNLERLLYHLSDNNAAEIKSLMESLDKNKVYEVSDKIKSGLKDFYGGYADVAQTNEAIGSMYEANSYLMDTHTAVAYKVYEDYKRNTKDETVTLIASTASAYKFAESVAESIGLQQEKDGFACVKSLNKKTGVRVPKALDGLEEKPILHKGVLNIAEMQDALEKLLAK
jgi:threonine synthase